MIMSSENKIKIGVAGIGSIGLHGCPQIALLLAIAGLMIAPMAESATTYYVATNGSDAPATPGTDWTTAFLTISNAVATAQASEDNIVLVSNGTYLTVAEIVLTNALTVRSWNNGVVDRTNTIVLRSGAAKHRLFHLKHVNALVEGFTITNGQIISGGAAGGGYIEQGGTLRNCIVANCVATNSTTTEVGGVMIYQTGLVADCVIDGNVGYRCGGVYLLDGGLVSNCVIINNTNTYPANQHPNSAIDWRWYLLCLNYWK